MTLRTCADCMHWQPPHTQSNSAKAPAYGACSMLVIDPRTRQVVPESKIDPSDLWRTDNFRTTAEFNACKSWAPADRRKTKPELTLLKGGAA